VFIKSMYFICSYCSLVFSTTLKRRDSLHLSL